LRGVAEPSPGSHPTGSGASFTGKVLSTPSDYSKAVAEGVEGILAEAGLVPPDVRELLHGTTIVTNTCIELTGARVGLITTRDFRDVLEITRGRARPSRRQDELDPLFFPESLKPRLPVVERQDVSDQRRKANPLLGHQLE